MRTSTIILSLALIAILSIGATSLSFYAPTTSGTSGQVLVSSGPNTAPTWKTPKKWYQHRVCMYDTSSWMMNVEFINNSSDKLNTIAKIAAQLKADGHTSYATCKSVVSTCNGDWMYYGLYTPTGSNYIYTYKKEANAWNTIGWSSFTDTVKEITMF